VPIPVPSVAAVPRSSLAGPNGCGDDGDPNGVEGGVTKRVVGAIVGGLPATAGVAQRRDESGPASQCSSFRISWFCVALAKVDDGARPSPPRSLWPMFTYAMR
jgi:hypothetical protein